MSFIKQTLKNTASLILAAWIIGTAYAAITTVNSGDPLTASSWNEMVTKITNTDTNSTDLTTKAYVDSTVSANSWGGWFPTMITTRQPKSFLTNALQSCRELNSAWFSDWRLPELAELVHFYWHANVTSDGESIWTKSRIYSHTGRWFSALKMNDLYTWDTTYSATSHSLYYYCVR